MDEIEEVKRKTDIVSLISESLALKKAGRNFKALCPFHTEKTPSFLVSPEMQIFKCFGCGAGGDVFKWMMLWEKMDFGEALRFLAKKAGVILKSKMKNQKSKMREKIYEINHLASEYYHYLLIEHKAGGRAREYLKKRGVGLNMVKLFKLGYAPEMWDGLWKYLGEKKKYKTDELVSAGLVIKGQKLPYDRFRGRLMFTLRNHRGDVIGFAGRVLKEGEKTAKYINTPETAVYHKREVLYGLEVTKDFIKKAGRAIVVEGELDVIMSFQAGVKNVAGIKGSALTEEQVRLLKRYTEEIALALDLDLAGDEAAKRGIETAEKEGLEVKIVRPEKGKDAADCCREDAGLWRKSVKKLIPIYDFILESAKKRYGLETASGKKKVADEACLWIVRITNAVVRAHYIKKLGEMLEVSEGIVEETISKISAKSFAFRRAGHAYDGAGKNQGVKMERERKKTRREILEEYLVSLVLQAEVPEKILAVVLRRVKPEDFENSARKRLFEELVKKKEGLGKKGKIGELVESLAEELQETGRDLFLRDIKIKETDLEKFMSEAEKAGRELKKVVLGEKMRELSAKMRKAKEDSGELEELSREYARFLEAGRGK